MSDKAKTATTTNGISNNIFPITPPIAKRGEKAATVVNTAKMTGMVTRRVQIIAAPSPVRPLPRFA